MPGPSAKHPDVRRRTNEKPSGQTIRAPEHPCGPLLPEKYTLGRTEHGPIEKEFDQKTRDWWNSLRRQPQATVWTDSEWLELRDLVAPMFDRWVSYGDLKMAKELRLQAKDFGLRPTGRNSLDWVIDTEIVGPARQPPAGAEEQEPSRQVGDFRVYDGDGDAEAS